jgi:hypothetical protein
MRKDTAPLTLSVPEAGERYFGLCRRALERMLDGACQRESA